MIRLMLRSRRPVAGAIAVLVMWATVGAAQADTLTTTYTVSGVRVIHRRTNTSIVAANLYLLGGVRQLTAATAGIETFLLAASLVFAPRQASSIQHGPFLPTA
jgi:hypothetical protein